MQLTQKQESEPHQEYVQMFGTTKEDMKEAILNYLIEYLPNTKSFDYNNVLDAVGAAFPHAQDNHISEIDILHLIDLAAHLRKTNSPPSKICT